MRWRPLGDRGAAAVDSGWKFNGLLETDEFRTHSFARSGPLNLTDFSNSGADWLEWSRTQPPDLGIRYGAMAAKRR